MGKLQCPSCGVHVATSDGWAKAALVSLVSAPAVPGMATQVRCPNCHSTFTQAEGGQPGSWRGMLPVLGLLALLLAVAFLTPA